MNDRIAVLGAGNMGRAIARTLPAGVSLALTAASPQTLARLRDDFPQAEVTSDNAAAAGNASTVILAVKPWIAPDVLREIGPVMAPGATLVSVVAGISTNELAALTNRSDINIVLAVPNTAIACRKSATFLTKGLQCSDEALEKTVAVFRQSGKVWVITESQIPACTALASCGIAYFLRFIRAATEGSVQLGLKAGFATLVAAATAEGAAALLADGAHPEAEIDKVTTPGGITIRGLNALEEHGFTNAVVQALLASAKR